MLSEWNEGPRKARQSEHSIGPEASCEVSRGRLANRAEIWLVGTRREDKPVFGGMHSCAHVGRPRVFMAVGYPVDAPRRTPTVTKHPHPPAR